jgi:transcriptional regulator with XRE-family HTH domain
MAGRTGMDRATISKLEAGRLTDPNVGTLGAYAKALGRRLTWAVETVEAGNA